MIGRRGYGPTREQLSVCLCIGTLGVNVRICRPGALAMIEIVEDWAWLLGDEVNWVGFRGGWWPDIAEVTASGQGGCSAHS